MSKRSIVLNTEKNLNDLRTYDCKLFVRTDGFRLVGILTKIKREYDSQLGKDRRWGVGITFDGDVFEEPLDRKNPKRGRLEDVVVRETAFMIITARKSSDPGDDDNNFSWLPHQFEMNKMKELEDELEASQRILNRLNEEHHSQRTKMDLFRREAAVAVDENNNLKETTGFLSRKVVQLERENQEFYTLLQRLRAHGLEVEGELSVELKQAMEKGREKAETPHQIRVKKLKEDEAEKKAVMRTQPDRGTDLDAIRDVVKEEVRKGVAQSQIEKKPVIKPPEEEIVP